MNYKNQVGRFGEKLACQYLVKKGYKIINNNFRIGHKEIDILAKLKEKIVFIEVKTRVGGSFDELVEAISRKKLEILKKAINNYIFTNDLNEELVYLEVVLVRIRKAEKIANIKHYKGLL